MKKLLRAAFLIVTTYHAYGQNEYFFPAGQNFDSAIKSPEEFLGYPVGEYHTRHDRMVSYFQYLAEASDRASFQTIGMTYEQRPQIVLTVTTPQNHNNLETIRLEHLKISDPNQVLPDISKMPAIITLGYNVHGNEPSSSEAALLTAYYLVASNSSETENYRANSVIFIDPAYNPDGRDRHTNWANMHRGDPKVADPVDREHNEVWPSGRVNHYWFDLNRDWLPLVHPESKARIDFYHQWMPNMVTDFHEMGTNSTYFFEPTKPFGSENPLVPRSNYDGLNNMMAKYFSKALDDIGSLYFTKEVYDNSYPGYGSTYPDIHGGLGIVFEQASSRGHLQQSLTKKVGFRFTIRNHLRSSLAAVQGTVNERETFLKHQREFFTSSLSIANSDSVKAYVFAETSDKTRLNAFIDLLLRHKIEIYKNPQSASIEGQSVVGGQSYIVPTGQKQYRMAKSIFEKVKTFHDSVFYDASAWSMALSYSIPHDELKFAKFQRGDLVTAVDNQPVSFKEAPYAYVLNWSDLNAPKALTHLFNSGLYVHAAKKPFSVNVEGKRKDFGSGSLLISVADQDIPTSQVHQSVKAAAHHSGLQIDGVTTGTSIAGIDLGSRNFSVIKKPKALMIVGEGIYLYEAGEIWHLLDTRVGLPITKVDKIDLANAKLNDYTTVVLVNGNYSDIKDSWIEELKVWIKAGGTLITQKSATSWAIKNGLGEAEIRKPENDENTGVPRLDYVTGRDVRGAQRIGGSIYEIDLDITHPIGYGYTSRKIPIYRNGSLFLEPSKNEFSTVGMYTKNPWLSGFVSAENRELIANSAAIVVSGNGRGRTVMFTDNTNFRGAWLGTSKLFLNALFFGDLISEP